METNRILIVLAVCVVALCCSPKLTFGDSGQNDTATCDISVTVESIIEWEGPNPSGTSEEMPDISLANINDQTDAPEGTSTLQLFINCNVAISADNTGDAQLTHTDGATDYLVTKYKISTDGDGDPGTGATTDDITAAGASTWTVYSSFLTPTALAITHYNTDGNVDVTLSVQATNDSENVADIGTYTATQTLTATWVSDN